MKKNKLLILLFFVFVNIFCINSVFAEDKDYDTYTGSIANFCSGYTNSILTDSLKFASYKDTKDKIIEDIKKKENTGEDTNIEGIKVSFMDVLKNTKAKYKGFQNSVYRCGVLQAQSLGISKVMGLVKIDKTGLLAQGISKLKANLDKIEAKKIEEEKDLKGSSCTITNLYREDLKQQVLDNSFYNMCQYRYYLHYLQEYANNNVSETVKVKETLITDEKSYNVPSDIGKSINEINTFINEEIARTYDVNNYAFTAFSEYEKKFTIHIMLSLIKTELIVYKQKLAEVLGPINQVVYKISNAMSK